MLATFDGTHIHIFRINREQLLLRGFLCSNKRYIKPLTNFKEINVVAQRDFKEYVRNELTHSPPNSFEMAQTHTKVSQLFVEFGEALAEVVPDGPDGTKMVNYLTIARAWAQKSVAQNFQPDEG
jgi:hypothetical protein